MLDGGAGEDPELPDELPAAPHFGPVGGTGALAPNLSTDWPGSGKATSSLCGVVQSVTGTLATNMSGKEAARDVRSLGFEPPVTVTGAQFMYISRLPTLLNHVHASVYCPGLMPSGMA